MPPEIHFARNLQPEIARSYRRKCIVVAILGPILGLALATCDEQHGALKVTMRKGATVVIADPVADYQRLCRTGQAITNDPEPKGLRRRDGTVVTWTSLATVKFGRPRWYEPGDYCAALPTHVEATLTMADGTSQTTELVDTADRGLTGQSERGIVEIPFATITRIDVLPPQVFNWYRSLDQMNRGIGHDDTVNITIRAGERFNLFSIRLVYPMVEDQRANPQGDMLALPSSYIDNGVRVVIDEARVLVPWGEIRAADLRQGPGHMILGRLALRDGSVIEASVPDASIDRGPNDASLSLSALSRIEVVAGK